MGQWQRVNSTDVVDVPPALDKSYKADPAWQPYRPTREDDGKLKGQELDDALKAADLPTTGSADEKRARLAEHTNT